MIFVDTSFLISLLVKTDSHHEKALKIAESIHERKVINSTVMNETLNAFTGKGGKIGKELYQIIEEMFDIEFLNQSDYEHALEIYLQFDSSINFLDCAILSTMIRNKIDKIISFDSDFEKVKGIKIIN